MKINYSILLAAFMLLTGFLRAQSNQNWQGIYLGSPDGTTNFNGVTVFYTLTTCNNNDILLLSMTNKNSYAVKVGWLDNVITNDARNLSRGNVPDSLTIQPQSSVTGDCTSNSVQLVIKLTDFGILKEDFKEFAVSKFDFVIIH